MSHQYYSELWLAAREDVEKILRMDKDLEEKKGGKFSKDKISGQLLPIYIRYRELINRLALCHDQICQSQKRELIKEVLNCAIGRMLEYKQQLVINQCTEFTYPDDVLIPMKLTPDDIRWRKPSYFVTDRQSHLEARKKYINDLIEKKLQASETAGDDSPGVSAQRKVPSRNESEANISRKMSRNSAHEIEAETDAKLSLPIRQETPEETAKRIAKEEVNAAVLLIQAHDRARKGRIVGAELKRMNDCKRKIASGEFEAIKHDKRTKVKAVVTIQKWWRGCATRLHLKERENRFEAVLGMSIPSWRSRQVFDTDIANFNRRLSLQPEYLAATMRATSQENVRVHRIRGPGLMEDISDEIRSWFLLWYNELGFFDTYPLSDAGGSVLIATGQTRTPEEYRMEELRKAEAAKKSKGNKTNEGNKKSGKSKLPGKPEEPATLKRLGEANNDFLENWNLRDETGNPHQREYIDLITNKLCYELQLEMREIVDELMRLELATLEAAIAKDEAESGGKKDNKTNQNSKKKKKNNKKNKDKENNKRSKDNRGRKAGKKKDPLSASTVDELFAELVGTGVIHSYEEVRIADWKGDVSYQNFEARRELRNVTRCLGDVIQPIMEYCILPIGSKEIHKIAPLVRSVSIIGLPRSGKSFLVNAICTEVGALLFDLGKETLDDNYKTKKELERLVAVVNTVARAFPPSVLFFENGHQPWWKKVPPEEKTSNPKRLAGPLTKLVKGIRAGDQILFLSTSDEPHKAGKPFIKIHDKFILIPLPDYGTLYLLYKELLMRYHGVNRNIDCSSLARISSGLPIEAVREAVDKVLSIERRITLKKRPLHPREIIEYLVANRVEVDAKAYENILKWERKTPIGKRRSKMEAEERDRQNFGNKKTKTTTTTTTTTNKKKLQK